MARPGRRQARGREGCRRDGDRSRRPAGAVAASSTKLGDACRARSTNSWTDSRRARRSSASSLPGSSSEGTRQAVSPGSPSGSRARGQDHEIWASRQEFGGQGDDSVEHVLAVVEDEQDRPARELVDERRDPGPVALEGHLEGATECRRDTVSVRDAGQLHEPHPVRPAGARHLGWAVSTAKRVLPAPPGPVSVSRRVRSSRRPSSASSRWRPTKLVDSVGRLCGHVPGSGHHRRRAGGRRRWSRGWGRRHRTRRARLVGARRQPPHPASPVATSATSSDRCTSSSSGRSTASGSTAQELRPAVPRSSGHGRGPRRGGFGPRSADRGATPPSPRSGPRAGARPTTARAPGECPPAHRSRLPSRPRHRSRRRRRPGCLRRRG